LLGFKATGIAAGSTAASMMSSAAIASGGAVKAGSLVAVCQSVGVVGLGTIALPIAAVGGGVGYAAYHYLIRPRLWETKNNTNGIFC